LLERGLEKGLSEMGFEERAANEKNEKG